MELSSGDEYFEHINGESKLWGKASSQQTFESMFSEDKTTKKGCHSKGNGEVARERERRAIGG